MSAASQPEGGLADGQTLAGKYRLVRKLGVGGMCHVYEAEHLHLKQPLALKILKSELASDPESVARFRREAQAAAKLRSPNVARVFDVDALPDGQPYITMELLVGHDLGTELQRFGALPIYLAADFICQAATGIAEAHALGIIHRDLKPENLFVTELGEMTNRKLVKILDFGIAKNMSDQARRLTAPDAVFGTVDYMSPEQIRSASSVDHRTDLWSLGVILYELLTARTPWNGDARSVIAQIVSDPVRPVYELNPAIPPSLVEIVMKALSKDPAARFQTAEELRDAVAPYAHDSEPISNVIARLPPQSMPRRSAVSSRSMMDEAARSAPTNLAFETAPPKRKRAWVLPITLATCTVLAGAAYAGRDALGDKLRGLSKVEAQSTEPAASVQAGTATASAPPAPSTEASVTLPMTPPAPASAEPDTAGSATAPATSAATTPTAAVTPASTKTTKRPKGGTPRSTSTSTPPAPTPAPAPPTLPKHL